MFICVHIVPVWDLWLIPLLGEGVLTPPSCDGESDGRRARVFMAPHSNFWTAIKTSEVCS